MNSHMSRALPRMVLVLLEFEDLPASVCIASWGNDWIIYSTVCSQETWTLDRKHSGGR